jgi:hypothetical protein
VLDRKDFSLYPWWVGGASKQAPFHSLAGHIAL